MQPVSFEFYKSPDTDLPLSIVVSGAETGSEQLDLIGILQETGVEASAADEEDSESLGVSVSHVSSAQELRGPLRDLDDHRRIELAEPIGKTLHRARAITGEQAEALSYTLENGKKVVIGDSEYGPYSKKETAETEELLDLSGEAMIRILEGYGINTKDIYHVTSRRPDRDTGACRLNDLIGLVDESKRDAIVSLFRSVIEEKNILNATIEASYEETFEGDTRPYKFSFTIMGDSIVSLLDACIHKERFLRQVEEKMLEDA